MKYGDVVTYTKYDVSVNALVVSHDEKTDEAAIVYLNPALDKGTLTQAAPVILYGVKKLEGKLQVGWQAAGSQSNPSADDLDATAADQAAKEATAGDEPPTGDLPE